MADYYFEELLKDFSQSKHSACLDKLFILDKYVLNKLMKLKFLFYKCQ